MANGISNYNLGVYNSANKQQNADLLKKQFEYSTEGGFNITNSSRTYSYKTNVAKGVEMTEVVEMGYMIDFHLLSVLQGLSGDEINISKLDANSTATYYTDLKDKNEDKTKDKLILNLYNQINKEQQAVFVMLTNLKNNDGKAFDDVLCTAAFDTLEFAQSINPAANGNEIPQRGGKLKFNKKQLKRLDGKKRRVHTLRKSNKRSFSINDNDNNKYNKHPTMHTTYKKHKSVFSRKTKKQAL